LRRKSAEATEDVSTQAAQDERLGAGDFGFVFDHADELDPAVLDRLSRHARCVAYPPVACVSKTLEKPIWRNTTIIRDNVLEAIRALKAAPGKNILTDGSSELVHTLLAHDLVDELHLLLYPLAVGGGKRLFPDGTHTEFTLKETTPYPSGVVGLHYARRRAA
jgi:dihydrofolate reductase